MNLASKENAMPIRSHSEALLPAWLDAYGHLNEAYYLLVFSNATWSFQDRFGLGVEYFQRTGNALYTLESHLRYLKEVRAPATLDVESMILGFDAKRLHVGHTLIVDATPRATFECVLLHVNKDTGRSCPFPDNPLRLLTDFGIAPLPDWSGSRVGLSTRKSNA